METKRAHVSVTQHKCERFLCKHIAFCVTKNGARLFAKQRYNSVTARACLNEKHPPSPPLFVPRVSFVFPSHFRAKRAHERMRITLTLLRDRLLLNRTIVWSALIYLFSECALALARRVYKRAGGRLADDDDDDANQ